eukprot:6492690-Amphidinium_carterae.2
MIKHLASDKYYKDLLNGIVTLTGERDEMECDIDVLADTVACDTAEAPNEENSDSEFMNALEAALLDRADREQDEGLSDEEYSETAPALHHNAMQTPPPPPLPPPAEPPVEELQAELHAVAPDLLLEGGAWGGFRISVKQAGKQSAFGGFECKCPWHRLNDNSDCKKLFSVRGPTHEDKQVAMRALKTWAITAKQHSRQRHHLADFAGMLPLENEALEARRIDERPLRKDIVPDTQLDELGIPPDVLPPESWYRARTTIAAQAAVPVAKPEAKAKGKAKAKAKGKAKGKPNAKPKAGAATGSADTYGSSSSSSSTDASSSSSDSSGD